MATESEKERLARLETAREYQDKAIDAMRQEMRDGFNSINTKIDVHIAEHNRESKTGRRWLIGIAVGVGIAVAGLAGQYLPAIIQALQSTP